MKTRFPGGVLALLIAGTVQAGALDERLATYRGQGAGDFSAAAGEALWNRTALDRRTNAPRSCANCHTRDLSAIGKHAETGKPIDPMSVRANPKRLTDSKFIEKWFLRNCKWTFGRECTPQEKGDFLSFIAR